MKRLRLQGFRRFMRRHPEILAWDRGAERGVLWDYAADELRAVVKDRKVPFVEVFPGGASYAFREEDGRITVDVCKGGAALYRLATGIWLCEMDAKRESILNVGATAPKREEE